MFGSTEEIATISGPRGTMKNRAKDTIFELSRVLKDAQEFTR